MKQAKKRINAKMLDKIETIKKLSLEEIRTERRWAVIWEMFKQKRKQFTREELPDDVLLEQIKQQILMIRQLSHWGLP